MKSVEERLFQFARKALPLRYPSEKGWKLFERKWRSGEIPDLFMERKHGSGMVEWAIADVVTEDRVERKHIEKLKGAARLLKGEGVYVVDQLLIVHGKTDKDAVPEDIKTIEWKEGEFFKVQSGPESKAKGGGSGDSVVGAPSG